MQPSPADFLHSCFLAGVAAVQPERCLAGPVAATGVARGPCAVLTVGKAAPGMARVIAETLTSCGGRLLPPLIIGVEPGEGRLVGDHPLPGPASLGASDALDRWLAALPDDADVHVGISGGASALIAAPLPGITFDQMQRAFELLLRSGLDIHAMNAVRKRITRWSAGRLALAIAPRRIFVWIISDVPGDDPATIASGPCHGDPWTSGQVRELLEAGSLWRQLPEEIHTALFVETPKPDAAELGQVHTEIVARNFDALEAAAHFADAAGIHLHRSSTALSGEARECGAAIAADVLRSRMSSGLELWIYGGETVVTLGQTRVAGGRNQELALAAAERLAGHDSVTLLAAGTDGRDGNTSAAGAIVNGQTWQRVADAGRDPAADLAGHAAHDALASANALLQTGPTGTNVMDVVLVLRGGASPGRGDGARSNQGRN